jgi:hypothetical protein
MCEWWHAGHWLFESVKGPISVNAWICADLGGIRPYFRSHALEPESPGPPTTPLTGDMAPNRSGIAVTLGEAMRHNASAAFVALT